MTRKIGKSNPNYVETRKVLPCKNCQRELPKEEFYPIRNAFPNGARQPNCIECVSFLGSLRRRRVYYDLTETQARLDLEAEGLRDPATIYNPDGSLRGSIFDE